MERDAKHQQLAAEIAPDLWWHIRNQTCDRGRGHEPRPRDRGDLIEPELASLVGSVAV